MGSDAQLEALLVGFLGSDGEPGDSASGESRKSKAFRCGQNEGVDRGLRLFFFFFLVNSTNDLRVERGVAACFFLFFVWGGFSGFVFFVVFRLLFCFCGG